MNLINNLYNVGDMYIADTYDDAITKMNQYHLKNGQFGLVYYYTDSSVIQSIIGVPGYNENDENITFCSEANKIDDYYTNHIEQVVKKSISDALVYNNKIQNEVFDVSANLELYKLENDSSLSTLYEIVEQLQREVGCLQVLDNNDIRGCMLV